MIELGYLNLIQVALDGRNKRNTIEESVYILLYTTKTIVQDFAHNTWREGWSNRLI